MEAANESTPTPHQMSLPEIKAWLSARGIRVKPTVRLLHQYRAEMQAVLAQGGGTVQDAAAIEASAEVQPTRSNNVPMTWRSHYETLFTISSSPLPVSAAPPPTAASPSDRLTMEDLFGYADSKTPRVDVLLRHLQADGQVSLPAVLRLVTLVVPVLDSEANLLQLDATDEEPIVVCGDTHGQLQDLLSLLEHIGISAASLGSSNNPSSVPRVLFLGDYVDRGEHSIGTLSVVYTLKLAFPQRIFLLRGNHEGSEGLQQATIDAEIAHMYGGGDAQSVAHAVAAVRQSFHALPIAAIVHMTRPDGVVQDVLCVHAGLDNDLTQVSQLNEIDRRKDINTGQKQDALTNLTWADPMACEARDASSSAVTDVKPEQCKYGPIDNDDEYRSNVHFRPNSHRNTAKSFSLHAVDYYLRKNKLMTMIRAHFISPDMAQDGYRLHWSCQGLHDAGKVLDQEAAEDSSAPSRRAGSAVKCRPSRPGQEHKHGAGMDTVDSDVKSSSSNQASVTSVDTSGAHAGSLTPAHGQHHSSSNPTTPAQFLHGRHQGGTLRLHGSAIPSLITVFSAPDYEYDHGNVGAFIELSGTQIHMRKFRESMKSEARRLVKSGNKDIHRRPWTTPRRSRPARAVQENTTDNTIRQLEQEFAAVSLQ